MTRFDDSKNIKSENLINSELENLFFNIYVRFFAFLLNLLKSFLGTFFIGKKFCTLIFFLGFRIFFKETISFVKVKILFLLLKPRIKRENHFSHILYSFTQMCKYFKDVVSVCISIGDYLYSITFLKLE